MRRRRSHADLFVGLLAAGTFVGLALLFLGRSGRPALLAGFLVYILVRDEVRAFRRRSRRW